MNERPNSIRVLAWVVALEWVLASIWMIANTLSLRAQTARPGTILFPTLNQCVVVIVLCILAIILGYGFCRFRKWGLYGSLVLGFLTNVPLAFMASVLTRGGALFPANLALGIACDALVILYIVCVVVAVRKRTLFQ